MKTSQKYNSYSQLEKYGCLWYGIPYNEEYSLFPKAQNIVLNTLLDIKYRKHNFIYALRESTEQCYKEWNEIPRNIRNEYSLHIVKNVHKQRVIQFFNGYTVIAPNYFAYLRYKEKFGRKIKLVKAV